MAYPIRRFEPQTIYFLTSRTIQSRFLMAPSETTNELIGGILARAVRTSGIELFAYVFTSNHFHAMARAPTPKAMSKFMQFLAGNIAKKVGRFVKWSGSFFGRRYSDEPILDEGAQLQRLRYILSHGVKEELVSEVRKWPGLSCARSLLQGGTATLHRWRNWTERWKMENQQGVHVGRFSKECPSEPELLTLAPLPCWAHLDAEERTRLVTEMVAEIDATASSRALSKPKAIARHICNQNPHGQPKQTKRTPRPKAHASSIALWIESVSRYRSFVASFRAASRQWMAGKLDAEFPPHSFRPPAWCVAATATVTIVV